MVSVQGTHNGVTTPNNMGPTDSSGNFTLNGTIDNASAGSWAETWYVGQQSAGSFSFQVAAPQGSSTGTGTAAGGSTGTSSTGTGTGTQTGGTAGTPAGELIPGVSNTYLALGGGAVLLLLMAMGGRR